MSIEHRWDARIPTSTPAALTHPTLGTVNGELSNVSEGGACILTGDARFPYRCACHVLVSLHDGPQARVVRLPVLVIWSVAGAAGLMFGHLDDMALEARDALLAHAQAGLAVAPAESALMAGIEQM